MTDPGGGSIYVWDLAQICSKLDNTNGGCRNLLNLVGGYRKVSDLRGGPKGMLDLGHGYSKILYTDGIFSFFIHSTSLISSSVYI